MFIQLLFIVGYTHVINIIIFTTYGRVCKLLLHKNDCNIHTP